MFLLMQSSGRTNYPSYEESYNNVLGLLSDGATNSLLAASTIDDVASPWNNESEIVTLLGRDVTLPSSNAHPVLYGLAQLYKTVINAYTPYDQSLTVYNWEGTQGVAGGGTNSVYGYSALLTGMRYSLWDIGGTKNPNGKNFDYVIGPPLLQTSFVVDLRCYGMVTCPLSDDSCPDMHPMSNIGQPEFSWQGPINLFSPIGKLYVCALLNVGGSAGMSASFKLDGLECVVPTPSDRKLIDFGGSTTITVSASLSVKFGASDRREAFSPWWRYHSERALDFRVLSGWSPTLYNW